MNPRCKFCGVVTGGNLFCSTACKIQFYNLLKENKLNNMSPEQYIRDKLNNPVNGVRMRFNELNVLAYVKTNLEMMNIKGLHFKTDCSSGRYLLYLKYDRGRVEDGKEKGEKEEDQVGQAGAAGPEEPKGNI
jgi:hypothetical protein